MHAAGIRFWNYAVYYGAISAAVLILLDLPQPGRPAPKRMTEGEFRSLYERLRA
jgi:hypothetical protein